MNRDYTQPHPDAIFKDKPLCFIEQYSYNKNKYYLTQINGVAVISNYIKSTVNLGHKTIALFIIKPKTI